MYEIVLTNTADKSQKNLDKPLRIAIRDSVIKISQNPKNSGEKLVSPLSDVYCHHIRYKGNEVRIAYGIDTDNKKIIIYLIAFHENFYRKLKMILDK
jgi:mRNA-degrading endonuclease RelE of RelBE toxin-antitoxin system